MKEENNYYSKKPFFGIVRRWKCDDHNTVDWFRFDFGVPIGEDVIGKWQVKYKKKLTGQIAIKQINKN